MNKAKLRHYKKPPKSIVRSAYERVSPFVKEGAPISRAFQLAGISVNTSSTWLQFAKRYAKSLDDYYADPEEKYEKHYDLFQKLKKDEAEWLHKVTKRGMNGNINRGMDWRRDISILERRDKNNWSKERKVKVTHSTKDIPPDERYL